MELITQRGLIREVAKRWKLQYKDRRDDITEKLLSLDLNTATAADIEAIIGNSSWTDIRCDECGRNVEKAVQLGEEPDYESATAIVCKACIRQAYTELGQR